MPTATTTQLGQLMFVTKNFNSLKNLLHAAACMALFNSGRE